MSRRVLPNEATEHARRLEAAISARDLAAPARFDELVPAPPLPRFASAAARAQLEFERAWHERRWDDVVASYAPGFQLDDRRAMVGLELSGESFLTNLRLLYETPESSWQSEVLATRGERLALVRTRFSAGHPGGLIEDEHLSVVERDAHGCYAAIVAFDLASIDAAYAELDRAYQAGEAAAFSAVEAGMRAFARAFADRDWDALAARCAPELVVHDHRRLGWESLQGAGAYLAALRGLVELAPDTKLRLDHVTMAGHGYLVVTVWLGTREGGPFEEPSLMVAELDDAGRIRRFDAYDLERLRDAAARLAEIESSRCRT